MKFKSVIDTKNASRNFFNGPVYPPLLFSGELCPRYRLPFLLQNFDITLDGFPDILNGFFPGLALADAAGQARTLSDPETILSGLDDDLSQPLSPMYSFEKGKPCCLRRLKA